jgi:hypothetical protein
MRRLTDRCMQISGAIQNPLIQIYFIMGARD